MRCTAPAATQPRSLWVSNSRSGSNWELHEATAVGDPPHMTEIPMRGLASIDERQWRISFQRGVAACRVVIGLELSKLPFQVTGIPERDMVKEFSADGPNNPLDERV